MKQGKTISGNIITLNKNVVKEISEQHVKQITFPNKQQANEYFTRYSITKQRGRKKERKTPQAKVYYSQLIIQL